jgi:hypothetical protein
MKKQIPRHRGSSEGTGQGVWSLSWLSSQASGKPSNLVTFGCYQVLHGHLVTCLPLSWDRMALQARSLRLDLDRSRPSVCLEFRVATWEIRGIHSTRCSETQ